MSEWLPCRSRHDEGWFEGMQHCMALRHLYTPEGATNCPMVTPGTCAGCPVAPVVDALEAVSEELQRLARSRCPVVASHPDIEARLDAGDSCADFGCCDEVAGALNQARRAVAGWDKAIANANTDGKEP